MLATERRINLDLEGSVANRIIKEGANNLVVQIFCGDVMLEVPCCIRAWSNTISGTIPGDPPTRTAVELELSYFDTEVKTHKLPPEK